MSLALALDILVPGALYSGSLTDDTQASYDALTWLDARPKPLYASVLATSDQVAKQDLKDFASMVRFTRQIGGYTYRGLTYDTDPVSVSSLNSVYVLALDNKAYGTQWKLANGTFVSLDANTIIAVYTAIIRFIEALFTAESSIGTAVDVGSITTTTQVTSTINSVPNVG
jgi:hypothetical protein